MGEDNLKLCKDCRYCRHKKFLGSIERNPEFAQCSHPKTKQPDTIDVVTGKRQETWIKYCSSQRMFSNSPNLCGTDGKWWEPKNFPGGKYV